MLWNFLKSSTCEFELQMVFMNNSWLTFSLLFFYYTYQLLTPEERAELRGKQVAYIYTIAIALIIFLEFYS